MKVETIPVLSDNFAYLVICEQSGQAAAIDPAGADAVIARLQSLGVTLKAIWNTHHHWDHVAGNEALLKFAKVPVFAHISDADRVPGFTDGVDHDDQVALGQLSARIYFTPGHTRGGICYHVEDALFTGDALFGAGCGRLFEGDPPTMYRSLNQVLASVPGDTRVFFGHEYTAKNLQFAREVDPQNEAVAARVASITVKRANGAFSTPSTMAQERTTNPFLRCDDPGIRAALTMREPGRELTQPEQVFAFLREIRNDF